MTPRPGTVTAPVTGVPAVTSYRRPPAGRAAASGSPSQSRSPRLTRVHSVTPFSVQRETWTPAVIASGVAPSSGDHSPAVRIPWAARCTRSMRRSVASSRRFQPTHTPNTASHTRIPVPFIHADWSSPLWSRFQRRMECIMWRRSYQWARCTPGASESANHWAQLSRWSSTRWLGTRDSPSRTCGGSAPVSARVSFASPSLRVSRKTPSTPSSATSAASSAASSRPVRRVPVSQGL